MTNRAVESRPQRASGPLDVSRAEDRAADGNSMGSDTKYILHVPGLNSTDREHRHRVGGSSRQRLEPSKADRGTGIGFGARREHSADTPVVHILSERRIYFGRRADRHPDAQGIPRQLAHGTRRNVVRPHVDTDRVTQERNICPIVDVDRNGEGVTQLFGPPQQITRGRVLDPQLDRRHATGLCSTTRINDVRGLDQRRAGNCEESEFVQHGA